MKKNIIVVLVSLTLSACAVNNEQSGVILGAIAGGVLGNQIGHGSGKVLATGLGIMIGAAAGGNIGRHMDRQDRASVARTLENSPTGRPYSWRNPDSGNQYTVTPTRTYETSGSPCREYTTTAMIGGKQEQVYGTACRQRDGSWKTQ